MKLFTALFFMSFYVIASHAYRDGAREESCYDHNVTHAGAFKVDCGAGCRYSLNVKEVVNETTLELGNETSSYECGKIYGIEVANDLNPPEGYLVQARDGTEVSSAIIGTFLNRSVVEERAPTIPLNFKILRCRRSINSLQLEKPLDNSATHPDSVNAAGILQLYWQAPSCSNTDLPNVTLWFTVVLQLTSVFNPSKSTILTYVPPPTTTSSMISPTTTVESTSQETTTMVPSPTSLPSPGLQLSMVAIIGIAAGGGGGLIVITLLVIIVIAAAVCCKSKKKDLKYKTPKENGAKEGFASPFEQTESIDNEPKQLQEYTMSTFKGDNV